MKLLERATRVLSGDNPLGLILLGMSREDRARYAACTDHKQLGELMALWLEGEIESRPGYQPRYGPDPETEDLIDVLAHVNRLGFVTDGSQPGLVEDVESDDRRGISIEDDAPPSVFEQRAFVDGWVEREPQYSELVHRLRKLAEKHDLIFVGRKVTRREPDGYGAIPVTRTRMNSIKRYSTWAGGARPIDEVRSAYRECSPEMVTAITRGWNVSLIDPVWGRNDVLWPALEEL